MIVCSNKKTGKPYLLAGEVKDATNGKGMPDKALYYSLESGEGYVRDLLEFQQKFSEGDSEDCDKILSRQGAMNYPMLTLLQGLAARLDMTLGLMDSFHEDPEDDGEALERSPEWLAYMAENRAFIDGMAESGLHRVMILKIQRQVYPPPDENTGYLVYDEEKKFFTNMTMPPEVKEMFGEADLKIYVKARLWCDGTLQVVHPVKEQLW